MGWREKRGEKSREIGWLWMDRDVTKGWHISSKREMESASTPDNGSANACSCRNRPTLAEREDDNSRSAASDQQTTPAKDQRTKRQRETVGCWLLERKNPSSISTFRTSCLVARHAVVSALFGDDDDRVLGWIVVMDDGGSTQVLDRTVSYFYCVIIYRRPRC